MVSLGALAILLIAAIVSDVRSYTISNRLTAAVALLAIPYWLAAGLPLWPGVTIQLGLAAVVLAFFALLFSMGFMGGGDVKLLAALALWLPPLSMMQMLIIMSLLGAIVTVAAVIRHRVELRLGRPEIPYGVAICLAALWVLGEPVVNQLAA
jgi:prepilin peptidase CpaA